MGFGRGQREGEDTEAIKRMFTPEFRNRLDATIGFAGLTPEIMAHVVEKFVRSWPPSSPTAGSISSVDAMAKAWLAEKGYDPLYGARPLARVIQEHIKRPLADELLFGTLAKGGKVVVTIRDGQPAFDCTPTTPPALLPPPGVDPELATLDDEDDEAGDQEYLTEEPVA